VIGLYTESFGNPRKFARIARRVSRTRPIVAVRTGSAALGNMGSALYQQAGLIEVPTVNAMLDVCRVLESQPVLRGNRVVVITNSPSPGLLTAAALESNGLCAVEPRTPLNWRAEPADYERSIVAALNDTDIDGVIVVFAPPVPAVEAAMGPTIDAASAGSTKPVVAVMMGSGDGPVADGSSVPGFAFPEQAVAALARSYDYGRWLATEAESIPITVRPVDPQLAAEIVAASLGSTDLVQLDVEDSARLLGSYGIAMAPAATSSAHDAPDVAERLGFPVAVKALRRHRGRSARAGVALDLTTRDDVAAAVATMVEALDDDASEVIVQQMTTPGIEVRIRCQHDDRLGVIVEVGYGGADADLIGDRTSRLAPVSPASASAMLSETKVGTAIADADLDTSPLVDTIVQAAQLCAEHLDIHELDLNPVIVSSDGAIVTDVSVVLLTHPDSDGPLRKLE
jgi:acyl-CoA synthetase (NDP forming)